jgi:hypothetical protein
VVELPLVSWAEGPSRKVVLMVMVMMMVLVLRYAGNILYNRGIAFVTYESEHNASFAKEAMANQSMDMEEILNVR